MPIDPLQAETAWKNPVGYRELASTEVGCSINTNNEGGFNMELEVVEGSCASAVQQVAAGGVEPMGCPEGGFIIGCCIIHFWCWSPGHGLCC